MVYKLKPLLDCLTRMTRYQQEPCPIPQYVKSFLCVDFQALVSSLPMSPRPFKMSLSYGICSTISSLLLVFLTLPSTWGQASTVTINQISAYYAQPTDVQDCLWDPGHHDIAYSIPCPSPVYDVCYCPAGTAQLSSVLSAITGCLTYWYSNAGALDAASATSVYSEYCQDAVSASGQLIFCHEHRTSTDFRA